MWRRKWFEREQVSLGMGFFGRAFRITFVSVANRNSPNYSPSSSPRRRPKRMQELNPEDSQRDNENMKRRKVDDKASYDYILSSPWKLSANNLQPYKPQSPLILESTTGGGREIWIIHGAASLKGQFEFEIPKNNKMSPDRMAYYIAFQEENADKIRALCIKENCQIFRDACRQMERMLLGAADTSAVALEILCGLTRTQIVLLSC